MTVIEYANNVTLSPRNFQDFFCFMYTARKNQIDNLGVNIESLDIDEGSDEVKDSRCKMKKRENNMRESSLKDLKDIFQIYEAVITPPPDTVTLDSIQFLIVKSSQIIQFMGDPKTDYRNIILVIDTDDQDNIEAIMNDSKYSIINTVTILEDSLYSSIKIDVQAVDLKTLIETNINYIIPCDLLDNGFKKVDVAVNASGNGKPGFGNEAGTGRAETGGSRKASGNRSKKLKNTKGRGRKYSKKNMRGGMNGGAEAAAEQAAAEAAGNEAAAAPVEEQCDSSSVNDKVVELNASSRVMKADCDNILNSVTIEEKGKDELVQEVIDGFKAWRGDLGTKKIETNADFNKYNGYKMIQMYSKSIFNNCDELSLPGIETVEVGNLDLFTVMGEAEKEMFTIESNYNKPGTDTDIALDINGFKLSHTGKETGTGEGTGDGAGKPKVILQLSEIGCGKNEKLEGIAGLSQQFHSYKNQLIQEASLPDKTVIGSTEYQFAQKKITNNLTEINLSYFDPITITTTTEDGTITEKEEEEKDKAKRITENKLKQIENCISNIEVAYMGFSREKTDPKLTGDPTKLEEDVSTLLGIGKERMLENAININKHRLATKQAEKGRMENAIIENPFVPSNNNASNVLDPRLGYLESLKAEISKLETEQPGLIADGAAEAHYTKLKEKKIKRAEETAKRIESGIQNHRNQLQNRMIRTEIKKIDADISLSDATIDRILKDKSIDRTQPKDVFKTAITENLQPFKKNPVELQTILEGLKTPAGPVGTEHLATASLATTPENVPVATGRNGPHPGALSGRARFGQPVVTGKAVNVSAGGARKRRINSKKKRSAGRKRAKTAKKHGGYRKIISKNRVILSRNLKRRKRKSGRKSRGRK